MKGEERRGENRRSNIVIWILERSELGAKERLRTYCVAKFKDSLKKIREDAKVVISEGFYLRNPVLYEYHANKKTID